MQVTALGPLILGDPENPIFTVCHLFVCIMFLAICTTKEWNQFKWQEQANALLEVLSACLVEKPCVKPYTFVFMIYFCLPNNFLSESIKTFSFFFCQWGALVENCMLYYTVTSPCVAKYLFFLYYCQTSKHFLDWVGWLCIFSCCIALP